MSLHVRLIFNRAALRIASRFISRGNGISISYIAAVCVLFIASVIAEQAMCCSPASYNLNLSQSLATHCIAQSWSQNSCLHCTVHLSYTLWCKISRPSYAQKEGRAFSHFIDNCRLEPNNIIDPCCPRRRYCLVIISLCCQLD